MSSINVFMAFGGGFLSFISPCVLPLYPAFLSYITGMSVSDIKEDHGMFNKKSIIHTIFFLIGFSSIFILLGFATSFIGDFLFQWQDLIRQIGAILIIFFGLVVVGVFNFEFLMKDRKIAFKNRPAGYFGSLLIGMAFSLGWTPCTGPILMAVISLAASYPETGIILMGAYALGFSVPFLILSFFIGKMKWIKRNGPRLVKIGGYVMIFMGIFLFFDLMTKLTSFLAGWFNFKGF
ncbi:cytochrome c biogenesis protein CcdA [Aquibacillus koreensis]|uniref:Cytochrome c biogenesis protein CcdA n=1 Tax=Aquibacillus koreensis TaxID=279446 RepID=A0A9X4AJ03_9BACI|nr:cytochrome c biogenesis protein CcdA [Aquibacillus koreensis]MCT2536395.1 cytochrome c biogenesis protein CcdA [Aquibacillus koreensis]MDC3421254.1 cytochrome c biogenesis protein CcdA [Aquibacillus koreensis]